LRSQVDLKNKRALSLQIHADIVINLGTGKTAVLNTEGALEEDIDLAHLNQAHPQVTEESILCVI
jgi:hypothetical protein